jgi:uroporphyrinogen decarboxylase
VQAGNDVREYRRRYPTLGIMCGLDKRALAASGREIDREVARCREMIRLGRYVPGFDHLIPPDVPWDNYAYAMREIRRACCDENGLS